jgi:hypothetical protein
MPIVIKNALNVTSNFTNSVLAFEMAVVKVLPDILYVSYILRFFHI